MRAVELPRALTDPQEVTRYVVQLAGARVHSGQGALVVHRQRLVRGVELHTFELDRIGSARLHECQSTIDVRGQLVVTLPGGGIAHEVLIPGMHLT
jgi:hypothetical protein